MVDAIIIDDLASPRLSAEQWAALVWGDANPVSLTVRAVLDAARERTGLADFGSDDFRERLGLLLATTMIATTQSPLDRLNLEVVPPS